MGRALRMLETIALVATPAVLVACAWFGVDHAALITSVVATLALVPSFARLEQGRRQAAELMPIVVLTSLAVAGRLVFAPVPAIKPVFAIVIMAGTGCGREDGLICGSRTMLVSNVFFGHGPWTPWQMHAIGLVGYAAGALADHGWLKDRLSTCTFGFAMALAYGLVLDTWMLVGFVSDLNPASILATYAAGAFTNLTSAVTTVVFLAPVADSWPAMFHRIRKKYRMGPASFR